MNRRISVELEFEHPSKTRDELVQYRSVLRKRYPFLRFFPDLSLLNTGLEVTFDLKNINEVKKLIKELTSEGFDITYKTGIHIHFDCSFNISLRSIKQIILNIKKAQLSLNEKIANRITTIHRRFFPLSVLKEMYKQDSIDNLFKVYYNELNGRIILKSKNDFEKALKDKGVVHNMWVDLLPLFRFYYEIPLVLPNGRQVGGYGSVEIRGPYLNNKKDLSLTERVFSSLNLLQSIGEKIANI